MLYDAAINLLDVLDHNAALLCSAVCGSSSSRSTWYWESWCASAMAVDRGFFSSSSFMSLLPPPSPLVTWLNSPSLGLFRSFIGGKKRKKKKKKQNNTMRYLLFHFFLLIDSTTTARQCLSLYKMSLCVCACVKQRDAHWQLDCRRTDETFGYNSPHKMMMMMRVAHRTPHRRVYMHHVSTLCNGFINWLGNRGWKRMWWMCQWSRCCRALMWRIGHSKTTRREIGEKKCLFLIVDWWWRRRRLDSRTKQTSECVCLFFFFFCWRNVTWQMIFFGSLTLLLLWKSSSCAATFRFLNGFFRLFFLVLFYRFVMKGNRTSIYYLTFKPSSTAWVGTEREKTNTNRREKLNKSSFKGEIQLLDCCWFYFFLVVPSNFFFPVLKVQSTLVGWLRNRFPGSLKQKWNSYTKERKKENCLDQM